MVYPDYANLNSLQYMLSQFVISMPYTCASSALTSLLVTLIARKLCNAHSIMKLFTYWKHSYYSLTILNNNGAGQTAPSGSSRESLHLLTATLTQTVRCTGWSASCSSHTV